MLTVTYFIIQALKTWWPDICWEYLDRAPCQTHGRDASEWWKLKGWLSTGRNYPLQKSSITFLFLDEVPVHMNPLRFPVHMNPLGMMLQSRLTGPAMLTRWLSVWSRYLRPWSIPLWILTQETERPTGRCTDVKPQSSLITVVLLSPGESSPLGSWTPNRGRRPQASELKTNENKVFSFSAVSKVF